MIDREAEKITLRFPKGKKKRAAVAFLAAAAGAAIYTGCFYTGWIGIPGTRYQYFIERGDFLKDTWVLRNETQYMHTKADAGITIGMCEIEGSLYYFGEDGVMQTGWQNLAGGRMHFASSGKASKGWYKEGEKTFYFSEDGIMQTGWQKIDGGTFCFEDDGVMKTGWQKIDGNIYCFSEDGKMMTGWQQVEGAWYLFSEDGKMQTGEQEKDGKMYYMDEDGKMQTGWRDTEEGKKYYADSGELVKGWADTSDGKRYFSEDGIMQTGWTQIGEDDFFFEDDGSVEPGWHESDDGDFYICSDGAVLNTEKEKGNYGRLTIRSCGIDVALNKGTDRAKYQDIVDAEDSAVVVEERRDKNPVISDRRSQGFVLDNVKEGASAYLVGKDGKVTELICVKAEKGKTDNGDVVDEEGDSIWKTGNGNIGMYARTDSDDTQEVWATVWEAQD